MQVLPAATLVPLTALTFWQGDIPTMTGFLPLATVLPLAVTPLVDTKPLIVKDAFPFCWPQVSNTLA